MGKILSVAFLIAFASLASAQACPTPADYETRPYWAVCSVEAFNCSGSQAVTLISMAFMFVTAAIAVAYMYSHARQDPAVGVWAKDEAFNLLISVFLFVGLLVFFTGSCTIAESYAGGNPFDVARMYITSLLRTNGETILRDMTYQSISNQLDATYYLYIGFTPFFGSGSAPRANMRAHSALKEFLIDLYLPIVASLNAQLYLLQAIQWVGASVLLPFAFVMRLLPPTRDFGNMLIALFFGLYMIVPTMYVLSEKVFAEKILAPPTAENRVDGTKQMFYSYGLDFGGTVQKETVFFRLGSTIPQAIFIPNLIIIVTVTCVMSLWKALRALAV